MSTTVSDNPFDYENEDEHPVTARFNLEAFEKAAYRSKEYQNPDVHLRAGIDCYQYMARRPDGTKEKQKKKTGRLKLNIPDTIVLNQSGSNSQNWLYTSKEGYVYRTDTFKDTDIIKRMGDEDDESTLRVVIKRKGYQPNTTDLQLCGTKELMHALRNASKDSEFVIQQYIRPKGIKAFVVRASWCENKKP